MFTVYAIQVQDIYFSTMSAGIRLWNWIVIGRGTVSPLSEWTLPRGSGTTWLCQMPTTKTGTNCWTTVVGQTRTVLDGAMSWRWKVNDIWHSIHKWDIQFRHDNNLFFTFFQLLDQLEYLTINECFKNPCSNGGTCEPLISGFKCTCPRGFFGNVVGYNLQWPAINLLFKGSLCEIEIDPCLSAPCLNSGHCSKLETGGLECDCQFGFEGTTCEVRSWILTF